MITTEDFRDDSATWGFRTIQRLTHDGKGGGYKRKNQFRSRDQARKINYPWRATPLEAIQARCVVVNGEAGPTPVERRQQRRQRSDKYDRRRSGPRVGSTPENLEADFGDYVESAREVPEWTEYKVIEKTTIDSWLARMGQLCLDVLDGFAPATVITNDEVPEQWHRDARRLLKGYGALTFDVEPWLREQREAA